MAVTPVCLCRDAITATGCSCFEIWNLDYLYYLYYIYTHTITYICSTFMFPICVQEQRCRSFYFVHQMLLYISCTYIIYYWSHGSSWFPIKIDLIKVFQCNFGSASNKWAIKLYVRWLHIYVLVPLTPLKTTPLTVLFCFAGRAEGPKTGGGIKEGN